MLLQDYLDRYNRTHDIRPSTLDHYHWVVRSFERHNGSVDTSALSATAVNDWLIWLADRGRSPWTIKQRKISLLVLWRAAWQDGLAPPLEPVRKLRPLQHNPQAWTLDEVRTLIATATAAGPWWSSLVRAGYDTGLRLGDLLVLTVEELTRSCVFQRENSHNYVCSITQKKTKEPVPIRFRPITALAMRLHLDGRTDGPVWPWPYRREAFYRRFKLLVISAAIRPGTFRWLRRTAATQLERVAPGQGTLLLGHASRSTTEAWYLDRSQLGVPPLPPL